MSVSPLILIIILWHYVVNGAQWHSGKVVQWHSGTSITLSRYNIVSMNLIMCCHFEHSFTLFIHSSDTTLLKFTQMHEIIFAVIM